MPIDRTNPRRAAVALVHGWERPGECRGCGESPLVLGTALCSSHYEAAMASGLRPSNNRASMLSHAAKEVAHRVWTEGVVGLRELEDSDGLDEALRLGWVTEADDDARPGPVEPTALPVAARAALLVRWLRAHGQPATHDEAADALGCTRAKLGAAVSAAEKAGQIQVRRGAKQTMQYCPQGAPVAPIVARITPEQRAEALARLVQARPLTRTEAARELGVSSRTVSLAATIAADRGWITARTGPGAHYEAAPA